MKKSRTDDSENVSRKPTNHGTKLWYQNKPESSNGKTNERSPLLSTQQKVSHSNAIEQNETKMDYKKIEQK